MEIMKFVKSKKTRKIRSNFQIHRFNETFHLLYNDKLQKILI